MVCVFFISSFKSESFSCYALLGMRSFSELFLFVCFLASLGVDSFTVFFLLFTLFIFFKVCPLPSSFSRQQLVFAPFFLSLYFAFSSNLFFDHGAVGEDGLLRMITFGSFLKWGSMIFRYSFSLIEMCGEFELD